MTPTLFRARRVALVAALCVTATAHAAAAQAGSKPAKRAPLSAADIAEIVVLERIEDRRDFDASALERIAKSAHPELRRRAALAIARLYDSRGRALLSAMRADKDTIVLATVVWATGQLVDTSSADWINQLLQSKSTPSGVATEAASAFGKIRTADTRAHLAKYLTAAKESPSAKSAIGEALLSIGRFRDRADLTPITRWTKSRDAEIRWRAAWALLRPRDPAAVPALAALAVDPSPEVRYWALRGLAAPKADSSTLGSAATRRILMNALGDKDRRARTEAVRTLGTYSDAPSLIQLVALIDDDDMWIATTAATALGARGGNARSAIATLTTATLPDHHPWIRATALTALADISLQSAIAPASELARDSSLTVRSAATDVLARLGQDGRAGLQFLLNDPDRPVRLSANAAWLTLADTATDLASRRAARAAAFASRDVPLRAAAAQSIIKWADSADIPTLLDAYAIALHDSSPWVLGAVIETLADIESRGGKAAAAFFARYPSAASDIVYGIAGRAFGPKVLAAWGSGRPVRTMRTDADYERIVNTLVVPAYNGAPPPRLRWETTRGAVDTDLNPLDAPLATDYLLSLTAQGAMRNIRFDRVVPNFVAQQREVLIDEPLQRDEISRGRLVRARLSWGSNIGNAERFPGTRGPGAAYDTGPAVYTFAHTVQPHNEGDFTALGLIVKGMDAVDRMELGDYVKSVTVVKP